MIRDHEGIPAGGDALASVPFRLGEWLVEPSLHRVVRDGVEVSLEPRFMRALVLLAGRPGRVITRAEMMSELWGEVVVNEEVLTHVVSRLRSVLGDDARSPRYIETIRKGGYRLVAPVLPAEEPAAAPPAAPSRSRPWRTRLMIACLVLVLGGAAWLQSRQSHPTVDRAPLLACEPLTTFHGAERQPRFSPEGERVAFIWDRQTGDDELFVKQLHREQPLALTEAEGAVSHPCWSPDGTALAYCEQGEDRYVIATVPALGGRSQRLAEVTGRPFGLSWSPDGSRLVYSFWDAGAEAYRLQILEVADRSRRTVTTPPALFFGDVLPVWSPDGERIAFVRGDENAMQDVFLTDRNGHEARRLTTGQRSIHGLCWTPGGGQLVYSATPNMDCGLWRLDLADGTATSLPVPVREPVHPDVDRAGGRLVFEDRTYTSDIHVVRFDAAGRSAPVFAPLITSTRDDRHARLSPDGRRLAFVSTRSGSPEIWLADADGARPTRMTDFGGAVVSHPRWSPDGELIAFHAIVDRRAQLYVLHVAEGRTEVMEQERFGDHQLISEWSNDGQWLYYECNVAGEWQIWRLARDGSRAEHLIDAPGYFTQESADGRSLYNYEPTTGRLLRMPLDGGPNVPVLDRSVTAGWVNYRIREQGIYALVQTPLDGVLAFYDFATERVDTLFRVPTTAIGRVDVSADGRTWYFDVQSRRESDLYLATGLD